MDLLERLKSPNIEDGLLRLLLALTLQYLHEFVQSEQLSRRLVHLCARKISTLVSYAISQQQTENITNQGATHPSTPHTMSPCPTSVQSAGTSQQNASTSARLVYFPLSVINKFQ